MFVFLFCMFFYLFCVFCVSVFFGVLFLLLYIVIYICVQFYRPLSPDGNPITVNKYHIKNIQGLYDQKCVLDLVKNTRYSCQIIPELEFSRQILEKYSSVKFHKDPSSV